MTTVRRAVTVVVAAAALLAGLVVAPPAGAATVTASVVIAPSVATGIPGCLGVPVSVKVSGAAFWNVNLSVAGVGMSRITAYVPEATDRLVHCPYKSGVGRFAVTGTVIAYDEQFHLISRAPVSGSYTITKTTPLVGLRISDASPQVNTPVRITMCTGVGTADGTERIPEAALTLTVTPSGGAVSTYALTADRFGCSEFQGSFVRTTTAQVRFSTALTPNFDVATSPPLTMTVHT